MAYTPMKASHFDQISVFQNTNPNSCVGAQWAAARLLRNANVLQPTVHKHGGAKGDAARLLRKANGLQPTLHKLGGAKWATARLHKKENGLGPTLHMCVVM